MLIKTISGNLHVNFRYFMTTIHCLSSTKRSINDECRLLRELLNQEL